MGLAAAARFAAGKGKGGGKGEMGGGGGGGDGGKMGEIKEVGNSIGDGLKTIGQQRLHNEMYGKKDKGSSNTAPISGDIGDVGKQVAARSLHESV